MHDIASEIVLLFLISYVHFNKTQHETTVAKFEHEFELVLFKNEVTLFL